MIGRRFSRKTEAEEVEPKAFDDFDLRLGDIMRGERATLGKSLLDVQRELRIKASYIAAIENCDPSAFDTPGFIAGYVRSYARYLGMEPDEAFATFCTESGFSVAHGMSAEASVIKKSSKETKRARTGLDSDPFAMPKTPFAPSGPGFWSEVEPRAIGSTLVLVALIGAIGFGGWSVLKEVQRVQVIPVEQTPVVLSDLDPLESAISQTASADTAGPGAAIEAPNADALDRLYRPAALDVPVLVARDAPISSINPNEIGSFAAPEPVQQVAGVAPSLLPNVLTPPQVVETIAPGVRMVAVRPAWVRVRGADGTVIFEGIMESGQTYDVPATEEPPTLRVGESGAIYFVMNGQHYGPVGPSGTVTSNLALSVDGLSTTYTVADLTQHSELARTVAQAQGLPQPTE